MKHIQSKRRRGGLGRPLSGPLSAGLARPSARHFDQNGLNSPRSPRAVHTVDMLIRAGIAVAVGISSVACGGDAALDGGAIQGAPSKAELNDSPAEQGSSAERSSEGADYETGSGRPEQASEPNAMQLGGVEPLQLAAYPSAPFGTTPESTIENLQLMGWRNPKAAAYDSASMEAIQLSDFYNPGEGGDIELLMINSVAVWCGACRLEYQEFADLGVYSSFKSRGLEMLGVLFEDNNADPARFSDMETWSRAFEVEFPFVIDPAFRTGAYFDRSATPMNMLVDAKTMKILFSFTGYGDGLFDEIDRRLSQRGR